MSERVVPILHVSDARATAKWYARLGFELEGEHRFAPGMPIYAFLKRGGSSLHLSEHEGDARPDTLVYFYVDDVDSIAAEFGVEVKDQPWGTREVWLSDPDGNRWRIGICINACLALIRWPSGTRATSDPNSAVSKISPPGNRRTSFTC